MVAIYCGGSEHLIVRTILRSGDRDSCKIMKLSSMLY